MSASQNSKIISGALGLAAIATIAGALILGIPNAAALALLVLIVFGSTAYMFYRRGKALAEPASHKRAQWLIAGAFVLVLGTVYGVFVDILPERQWTHLVYLIVPLGMSSYLIRTGLRIRSQATGNPKSEPDSSAAAGSGGQR